MLIVDAMVRDCSLDSIDAHIPKLDVAGSIPVSRFLDSAGPDRPRLARLPNHLLRTDGLFDLHLAAGEPAELADRAEGTGACRILHLFGHGSGELSSANGEEAAGLFGVGGKAPRRRIANHGRRRRFAHGYGP